MVRGSEKYVLSWQRGFTLLELIVVIFIISLLAGAVFPSFSGMEDRQISSDARMVASLMRYLNDSSAASKETISLEFDFRESVLSWDSPEGKKKEKIRTLAGIDFESKGLIREGNVTIFFSPAGLQEYTEVLLRDEKKELKISVNPVSGRVKVLPNGEQDS
jgi:general secretion pathway protein H